MYTLLRRFLRPSPSSPYSSQWALTLLRSVYVYSIKSFLKALSIHELTAGVDSIKVLRCYYGAIKALLRLYEGAAIKALLRLRGGVS